MANNDTRTNILDVAQDLIQRRGINGMSFQDISDTVGIRKPSIHHHFASKEDLVEALLMRYRTEFDAMLADILHSNVKARTKLQRYGNLFDRTLRADNHDKSCLCGMLAADVLSLGQGAARAVREFLQDNVKFLTRVLNEGKEDGSLSVRGSVEATASLVLASLEGGLVVARADGGPEQMSSVVRQLIILLAAKP